MFGSKLNFYFCEPCLFFSTLLVLLYHLQLLKHDETIAWTFIEHLESSQGFLESFSLRIMKEPKIPPRTLFRNHVHLENTLFCTMYFRGKQDRRRP